MLIFTSELSARLHYACGIVLGDYEATWKLTDDINEFNSYSQEKIFYSNEIYSETTSINVIRNEMMWTENWQDFSALKVEFQNDLPVLFGNKTSFGFDVFSAVFFLISRYEEYHTNLYDDLKRFSAQSSILFEDRHYRKPLVDIWIKHFQEIVMQKWPAAKFRKTHFQFISSIDVDSAFAHNHKGVQRTLGGIVKDLLRLNFVNLKNRLSTLVGLKGDDYDTYDYIQTKHKLFGVKNIFFFLLADFGERDKNLPHTSVALSKLIETIAEQSEVGIHPGYASNSHPKKLEIEKNRLEKITKQDCKQSRQHYLMLAFPQTYSALLAAGITHDYTMSYADDVGFRAGTSRPFKWFDLEKNEVTELVIHPFAAMDTTLNKYLNLSPAQANDLTKELMNEVKKVNGTFISLWHNETLSETREWIGWRKVWEQTLKMASSD